MINNVNSLQRYVFFYKVPNFLVKKCSFVLKIHTFYSIYLIKCLEVSGNSRIFVADIFTYTNH